MSLAQNRAFGWCSLYAVLVSAFVALAAGVQVPPDYNFLPVPEVQAIRLASTPLLDGNIAYEEWQELEGQGPGNFYFQWEPGVYHFAARIPNVNDLVLSLDLDGNGWLNGSDNYEVRVRYIENEPSVAVRRLLNVRQTGPEFRSGGILPSAIQMDWDIDGDSLVIEGSIRAYLLPAPRDGMAIGLRMDSVPQDINLGEAFMPRPTSRVFLQFDLGQDLVPGLAWSPAIRHRSVVPMERITMRFGFERMSPLEIRDITIRGEGFASEAFTSLRRSFPNWSRTNRAGVDYRSEIAPGSTLGWRVLRADLIGPDGSVGTVRTSVRIAPLVDIESSLPLILEAKDEPQLLRGQIFLNSQAVGTMRGEIKMGIPSEWTIVSGQERSWRIGTPRGRARNDFEIIVPANAEGTFFIDVTVTIGEFEYVEVVPVTFVQM